MKIGDKVIYWDPDDKEEYTGTVVLSTSYSLWVRWDDGNPDTEFDLQDKRVKHIRRAA